MRSRCSAHPCQAQVLAWNGRSIPSAGWRIGDLERAAHPKNTRQTLEELLRQSFGAQNHGIAVEIASLPEQIRGFDSVKEEHLETAREKEAELLTAFRARS